MIPAEEWMRPVIGRWAIDETGVLGRVVRFGTVSEHNADLRFILQSGDGEWWSDAPRLLDFKTSQRLDAGGFR